MPGYRGKVAMSAGAYYAPYTPTPDTWQSYLSRLGNGLNGVATNKYITEKDILDNAQQYMQLNYPGKYTVEPFYNSKKMKVDLRLKFDDPREETFWLLRYS